MKYYYHKIFARGISYSSFLQIFKKLSRIYLFVYLILICAFVQAQENGRLLEEKILEEADIEIEKHRKSDAVVKIINQDEKPVPDVKIKIRQISSDFLFACNVTLITGELGEKIPIEHYRFQPRLESEKQVEEFKKRFLDLFNCATVPLYWKAVEPVEGKPDYSSVDRVIKWLKSNEINIKGHTLVWVHGDNLPLWFRAYPPQEQRKLIKKHIQDVVSRFKGRVDMWDMVNEAAWANNTLAGMSMGEYTSLPFIWAREADPDVLLAINDAHKIIPPTEMVRYWGFLYCMNQNQVPYDIIGVQVHVNHDERFPLENIREILRKYSELKKPIHVTEFTPGSQGIPIRSSWKQGNWTEGEQAEYVERFYRLCFSIPAVKSIGWWDLSDYSAWVVKGGLIREDMTPKPAYETLKKLIHETWKTNLEGKTDQKGLFKFRGFHGKYKIQLELGKKIQESEIHIKINSDNNFSLLLID
ncbi:hypothetical protein GF312_17550 [Candidatus Poribacteria bacterium]|nr:hypothetical protein [Candidatus Poribacteria bacterium]